MIAATKTSAAQWWVCLIRRPALTVVEMFDDRPVGLGHVLPVERRVRPVVDDLAGAVGDRRAPGRCP